MAFAGAANIEDGVTLDLRVLNHFSFSENMTSVTLGPGLRWGEVYNKLATQGLAVPGARSADVGVGGYLLGGMWKSFWRVAMTVLICAGGSSYFIPYGFGCDNVVAYRIVVASGAILDVNAFTNADLF